MAFKQNTASRNVVADAFADLFDGATLTIRSGAAPGPNSAASGSVLATITLPTPAFGAASSGATALSGTWQDPSADGTGTAAHFRVVSSSTTHVMEGTVTTTGGGGYDRR